MRAALVEALKKNKGRLCVDSRTSRLGSIVSDLKTLPNSVAVAALVAIKDYLDDRGGKVSLGFVGFVNTHDIETRIGNLAKPIGIDQTAFSVIVADSLRDYAKKLSG